MYSPSHVAKSFSTCLKKVLKTIVFLKEFRNAELSATLNQMWGMRIVSQKVAVQSIMIILGGRKEMGGQKEGRTDKKGKRIVQFRTYC